MEKTKLGVSAGLVAAVAYFTALFGGYLIPVLIAGYVLICEQDAWLRKNALKAVALSICFSLLGLLINLLPDAMDFVCSVLNVFHVDFRLYFIDNVAAVFMNILRLLEKVVFVIMGLMAFKRKEMPVPGLDKLLEKSL